MFQCLFREGKVLMMKMLKAVAVLAIALACVGTAQAGLITGSSTFEQMLGLNDGTANQLGYSYASKAKDFTFDVDYIDTPTPLSVTVTSVTLDIDTRGANNCPDEFYDVWVAGVNLGQLVDNYGDGIKWSTTTFSETTNLGLDLLMPTADGPLTVTVVDSGALSKANANVDYNYLNLAIGYDYEYQPVVPTPSAIVLCSLGTGLVAWMRRRVLS